MAALHLRHRIDWLTGVRGYLALWVFGFHARTIFTNTALFENAFFRSGYLGVDGFFVLSGFVIFYIHGAEMERPSAGLVGAFIKKRVARIYPMHLFTLGIYITYVGAMLAVHKPLPLDRYSLPSLLAQLFLVQSWVGYWQTWNIPAWSLSAEWALYLCFPLFAWLVWKVRPLVVLPVAAIGIAYVDFITGVANANLIERAMAEFMLGSSLCYWPASNAFILRISPRPFANRVAIWLGNISYSFYMLHFLILSLARIVAPEHLYSAPLVALAVTLCFAQLTYSYIEKPFQRAILKR